MRTVKHAPLLVAAIVAGACSESGTGPAALDHIEIQLLRRYRSFPATDTMQATVIGYARDGTWMPTGTVAWRSRTPAIAAVISADTAQIIAVSPGDAIIEAEASGQVAQVVIPVRGTMHRGFFTQGNQVWRLADTPHVVREYLIVGGIYGQPETTVVTIEAGATVRFRPRAGLIVGDIDPGVVRIPAGAPVVMEGDSAGHQTWIGITFHGAGRSELRHLTIRGCGHDVPAGYPGSCLGAAGKYQGVGPELLLDSVTIRDGHNALELSHWGRFAPGSRLLSVENSDGYLGHISPQLVGSFPKGGHFTGNAESALQITNGLVEESATWMEVGAPWCLTGGVIFSAASNPVLTLPAGFHLRSDPGGSMTFEGGGIIAGDRAGAPVVLESSGDGWGGLNIIHGGGSALTNVTLRDCGLGVPACLSFQGVGGVDTGLVVQDLTVENSYSAGVSVDIGSFFHPTSSNLTIRGSANVPLSVRTLAVPSIPNGTYTGNASDAIRVRDGNVQVSGTWRNLGIPYLAPDGVGINTIGYDPPTLTIEPGVTVLFGVAKTLGIGSGTLFAVGTPAQHIVFGSMTPGIPGSWIGIGLGGAESHAQLEYVEIVDAGAGPSGYSGAVRLNFDPGGLLRNSTIRRSGGCGLILFNGQPWTDDYTDPAFGNSFVDLDGPARCSISP